MQINPFNQPDVEAAKIEARKITDEYEKTGFPARPNSLSSKRTVMPFIRARSMRNFDVSRRRTVAR
jgi:hypothetical protein